MTLKLLVLVPFAAAFGVTMLWFSAAERQLTHPQQQAAGVAAIVGWILTFAFASIM
jgi:hypothetical protein